MNRFILVIQDEREIYFNLYIVIQTSLTIEYIEDFYNDKNALNSLIKEKWGFTDGDFIIESIQNIDELPTVILP